jgi:hypothetical protein
VLIVSQFSEVFTRMLHIVATPWTVNVDVTTNGTSGFGGTNVIINDNFSDTPLQPNTKYVLTGQIAGDALIMNWGGKTYQGRHALLTNVVGPFFTHESFYNATNLTNRIHLAWANSPSIVGMVAQPMSQGLTALDRGFARIAGNLIVGTNPSALASQIEADKALVDGNIKANGWFR